MNVVSKLYIKNSGFTISDEAKLINVTYSELVDLRDNDELNVGSFYRITNYVTTTTQENTQSANHQFDIIVQAIDVNKLSEIARAIRHSGDTYFSGATLEAWELKYSLDNDTSRFAWADDTNGKGVIYWMKDEWNNECSYDFKNIRFKRWAITNITSSTINQTALNSLKETFVYSDGSQDIRYSYQSKNYDPSQGISFIVDDSDYAYYYTFTWINEDGDVEDLSIVGNTLQNDEGKISGVYDNVIGDTSAYGSNLYGFGDSLAFALNDNCIISTYSYEGGIFYGAYGNKFGAACCHNTFGNYCYYNTFGNGCYENTFGNNCGSNTFGNGCGGNTFGNDCYYNTFGNNFYGNTFGNYFQSNTFGNECWYNTFGNYCDRNSFGNNCGSNTFGNNFYRNSFGNECYSNTFGNNCNNIKFSKDYCYYNIVENGNQYITLTSTQTTASNALLRNITISQGVNNSTTKTISHNTVNDTFKTTYQNSASTIVNV